MSDLIDILASFNKKVADHSTPILLVTGTLLGLISLRNGHLSDRARNNVDEYLYKLPNTNTTNAVVREKRAESLKYQNKIFLKRYLYTSTAFVLLLFALVFFAISDIGYAEKSDPHNWYANPLYGIFGVAASVLLLIGLLLILIEFVVGDATLKANNKTME